MEQDRDFSTVRVGDRLWSVKYGHGKATKIIQGHPYPIVYESEDGINIRSFRTDGKEYDNENPTLYWSKPAISGGLTPPKRMRKVAINVYLDRPLSIEQIGSLDQVKLVGYAYNTIEDAQGHVGPGCIATAEIEVEK